MVRDEYEFLARNDAFVATSHLISLGEVYQSLTDEFDPRASTVQDAIIGLTKFVQAYELRMNDISTITALIDKARMKHSQLQEVYRERLEALSQTTKQLEDLQDQHLDLLAKHEEVKKQLRVAFS
jgi:ABC-type transporter Mla subunit MlaD